MSAGLSGVDAAARKVINDAAASLRSLAKSHGRNNVQNCETLIAAGAIATKVNDGDVELF